MSEQQRESSEQAEDFAGRRQGRGPSYKLVVAYDGSHYAGWQLQCGQLTVQEVIEAALAPLTAAPVRVQGSGRTDSGVHARGQIVSFDADQEHMLLEVGLDLDSLGAD